MTKLVIRLALVLLCLGLGALEATAEPVTKVAAGYLHTCALTASGGVVCWGGNEDGELGDGTTTSRPTPGPVSGLESGVTAIAVGTRHTCALTTAGAVWCWGDNEVGQLGDGTTTNRLTPVLATGLGSGIAAIEAGGWHTCALTTSGGMVCWGLNMDGELGDGTRTDRLTPTAVTGLSSGVAAMAGGTLHTCALTTGGGVLCWGDNSDGQLGDGTTTTQVTPVPVTGLGTGVADIVAGGYHTCAVTTGGGALCWGYNEFGQVGDGTFVDRSTPTAVTGMGSGVAALAGGWVHTCALTTGGKMVCWGDNFFGEVGDGTAENSRSTPVPVSGLGSGAAGIAGGWEYTCAVTTSGGVLCWGLNDYGQLGDGTTTDRVAPTPVSGLAPAVTPIAVLSLQADHALTIEVGTPVTWRVTSAGGAAPLEYAFYRYNAVAHSYTLVQPYSPSTVYTWTPAASDTGFYYIEVLVRSQGATVPYETYLQVGEYRVYVSVPPITITSLSPNKAFPFTADGVTSVTWTATATGGVTPLQYAFYRYALATRSYTLVQPYGASNTYTWTPAASDAGWYYIEVQVRSAGSTAPYEAYLQNGGYQVLAPAPPIAITSLLPNKAFPFTADGSTSVTWTATATGGVAPLQYAFYRYSVATRSYTLVQPYGTSSTYTWTPTASDTGWYYIEVMVRSATSSAPYDAYLQNGGYQIR